MVVDCSINLIVAIAHVGTSNKEHSLTYEKISYALCRDLIFKKNDWRPSLVGERIMDIPIEHLGGQCSPGNSLSMRTSATAGGQFMCQSQLRPTMSCRWTRSWIPIPESRELPERSPKIRTLRVEIFKRRLQRIFDILSIFYYSKSRTKRKLTPREVTEVERLRNKMNKR